MASHGVLQKDDNGYPVAGGISSTDSTQVLNAKINPSTGRLLIDNAGGGSGTVTSVSVATANGFAGTVANATTTPAITITTSINAPVLAGNGTALSAATTTGSGSTVVLDTSPTLVTPVLGVATATTINKVTITAPASGSTLTIADGKVFTVSNTLTFTGTDSSSVAFGAGGTVLYTTSTIPLTVGTTTIASGNNTRILYNNSGVLGEYTLTGTGTVVVMATSPTFTTGLTTPQVLASSNGSGSLGASGTAFTNLFLNAAGKVDFGAGDVTITNATNLLSFAGASTGYTFDAPVLLSTTVTPLTFLNAVASSGVSNLQILGTTNATSAMTLGDWNATAAHSGHIVFYKSANATIGNSTVVANGDQLGQILFTGAQQTGTFSNQNVAAMITAQVDGVVTSGAGADMPGRILFSTTPDGSGTPTDRLIIDSAGVLKPAANDGIALGTTALNFSDLFLASGAVINYANSDVVITHTTGILTMGTGDFRVTNAGANTASVVTVGGTQTLTAKTLTSPTIQTSPVLAAATNLKYTVPSSDVTGTGVITNEFNSGYSSTAIGDLVYLDSSSTWQKADADASAATYSSLLGIALSVTASASPATVLLQGFVYAAAPFPTFTIGAPIYMSATAGAVTQTAPVTTDSATRIVGYAVHADKMWFSPSNDWITHT